MKYRIVKCIENLGVCVDSNDIDNCELDDFIEDSLTFISFIIELEGEFEVNISDDMLEMSNFKTINQIEIYLNGLLSEAV